MVHVKLPRVTWTGDSNNQNDESFRGQQSMAGHVNWPLSHQMNRALCLHPNANQLLIFPGGISSNV